MDFDGFDDDIFGEKPEANAKKESGTAEKDSFDFSNINFDDFDKAPAASKAKPNHKDIDNFDDFDFGDEIKQPTEANKQDSPLEFSEPDEQAQNEKPKAKKETVAAKSTLPENDLDPFGDIDDFEFGEKEAMEQKSEKPAKAVTLPPKEEEEVEEEEFDDFGNFGEFDDDFTTKNEADSKSAPAIANKEAAQPVPDDFNNMFDDFNTDPPENNKSSEKSSAKTSRSSSKKSFLSAAKKNNESGEMNVSEKTADPKANENSHADEQNAAKLKKNSVPELIHVEQPVPIQQKVVYVAETTNPSLAYGEIQANVANVSGETNSDVASLLNKILSKLETRDDGRLTEIQDSLRDAHIAQRQLQDDLMSFEANVRQQISESVGQQLGLINSNYAKLSSLSDELEQKINEAENRQESLKAQGNEIQKTNMSIEQRRKEIIEQDEDVQARERELEELREAVSQMQFQAAEVLNSAKEALQEMSQAKQVLERKTLSINFDALENEVQDIYNRMELIESPASGEQINPQAIRTAVKLEIQEMQQAILQTVQTELSSELQQLVLEPMQRQFMNYTENIQRSFDDQASQLAGIITAFKQSPQSQGNANLISFLNAEFVKLQQEENCEAHVASIKIANERAASAEAKLHEQQEELLREKEAARNQYDAATTQQEQLKQRDRELTTKQERADALERELEMMREQMFEREKRLVEKEQTAELQIQQAQERKKRLDLQEYQLGKVREDLEQQKEDIEREKLIIKHEKTEMDVQQIEEQNERTFNLYRAYSAGKQQFAQPVPSQTIPSTYAITRQNLEQAMQRASRLNGSSVTEERVAGLKNSYGSTSRPVPLSTVSAPVMQAQPAQDGLRAQVEQQQEMMRAMLQQMQQFQAAQQNTAALEPQNEPQRPASAQQMQPPAPERKSSSLPTDATLVLNKPFTPMPAGATPAVAQSRTAMMQEITPENEELPKSVPQDLHELGKDTEKAPDTVEQLPAQIQPISFSSRSASNPFDKPNELARDLAKLADESGISSASVSATEGRIKPLPNQSEFSTEMGGSASGSHLFNDSESLPNVRFDENVEPNTQVRNPFDAVRDSGSGGANGHFKYNEDQFNIFGTDSKSDTPFFPF